MNQAVRTVRRGDVYLADLNPAIGCEQGGIRPVPVQGFAGTYADIVLYAVYRFHASAGANPHHRQVQAQRLPWQHKRNGNA